MSVAITDIEELDVSITKTFGQSIYIAGQYTENATKASNTLNVSAYRKPGKREWFAEDGDTNILKENGKNPNGDAEEHANTDVSMLNVIDWRQRKVGEFNLTVGLWSKNVEANGNLLDVFVYIMLEEEEDYAVNIKLELERNGDTPNGNAKH